MKPKFSYASKDEIPEAFRSLYAEKDGAWVLDVDGAVSAERLKEFRDKNITLTKEVETLKKTWEGFDPEEVKGLIAKKAEIEAQKAKDKGELEKLIEERVKAMREQKDAEIAKLAGERDKYAQSLNSVVIEKSVLTEAQSLGLVEGAADDLIFRAGKVWKLEGEKPVAYAADGKPMYDSKAEPMTIKGWLEALTKQAPHLFKPSQGAGSQGGAGGSGGSGAGGAVNPWKKESFNMTKQGEIFRQDPAQARRLAAEAGVTLPG